MTVTAQKSHVTWAQIEGRRNSREVLRALEDGRPPASGVWRPIEPIVPLILDGEVVEDIERFNATRTRALFMTRLSDKGAVALGAFTDRAAMLSEARSMSPDMMMDFGLPTFCMVWDKPKDEGDHLAVEHGCHYSDLSRVPRGDLPMQTWADSISCLDACQFDVSLFPDINFMGDGLFVPAGNSIMDMTLFGLQTSSIINHG